MDHGRTDVRSSVLATAASLSVDAMSAEVTGALKSAGIPSILLKGPAIASWLYTDGTVRPYGDCDLLIPCDRVEEAEGILRDLGFSYVAPEVKSRAGVPDGLDWMRGADAVDVHVRQIGMEAPPDEVWNLLSRRVQPLRVGGRDLDVLEPGARALVVALHAAHHGRHGERPLADLARAIEQVPFDVWVSAADLARRLEAQAAFSAGLRLLPTGQVLAQRLKLSEPRSVDVLIRAGTAPPLALGIAQLFRTPGITGKLRFIMRKLFPTPDFMRVVSRTARTGRAGLLLAYLRRPLWLARHLGPGVRAWRDARRAARG